MGLFRRRLKEQPRVIVDDHGVRRTLADGRVEEVAWEDLIEVSIRTTGDGPWQDDVFFLLSSARGGGCAVSSADPASGALLERLQRLPAFDHGSVIAAMGSTEDALFVCWRREGTPPVSR